MARPSPVPCPSVGALRRVNSSKIRSRSGTGMPGPWSITCSSNHGPRTPPRRSIAPPDGSWTAMFSSRFTSTCSMNNASTHTSGSSGSKSRLIVRPSSVRPERSTARRTRSTAETVTSSGRSAPARIRVSSRTLFTSPSSRAASAKVSSSSSRRSVGSRRESSARSAAVAALMVASGVRRSWVTPVRNPARDRARSPCTRCSRAAASIRSSSRAVATAPATPVMVSISSFRSVRAERTLTSSGGVLITTSSGSPAASAASPGSSTVHADSSNRVVSPSDSSCSTDACAVPRRTSSARLVRNLASRSLTRARRRSSFKRAIVAATNSDTETNARSATMSSA